MAPQVNPQPPEGKPWFARDDSETSAYDAQKAMTTIQLGLAGFAVLYAFWFTAQGGFMGNLDPIAPMALIAALILVAQYAVRDRLSLAARGATLQVSTYVIITAYLVWRFALGNPVNFSTYVLIPVFSALIFGRLRTAMVSIGFAAVWTIVMIGFGVIADPVDAESTMLAVAIGGLVAFILDKERRSNDQHTFAWRKAHGNLESVLRSSQEPIFSVDAKGAIQFSNEAGEEWCEKVTNCGPDASRFWTKLPDPYAGQIEKAFSAALTGQRARTNIKAPVRKTEHHWEVTAVPHRDQVGAILTIRDVTDRDKHQEAILDSQIKARMDMLNLVSHELSTPLMPILIESHVLTKRLQEIGDKSDVERMHAVTRNVRRAINMVHQLIDQSRGLQLVQEAEAESKTPATADVRPKTTPTKTATKSEQP